MTFTTEQDQRLAALRDVVRSCIHGVDRNPMAVELTKVALWIETVEPGKPLGFLRRQHPLWRFVARHLFARHPDVRESLMLPYKPLIGDDKNSCEVTSTKKNKDED